MIARRPTRAQRRPDRPPCGRSRPIDTSSDGGILTGAMQGAKAMREVVIVGAARTPIGSFLGELSPLRAPELGAIAIKEALARAKVAPGDVGEVFMGCVLPAGV